MNWDQARNLLRLGRSRRSGSAPSAYVDPADVTRSSTRERIAAAPIERARPLTHRVASSVCVASGEAEHVARRVSDVTRKFLGRDLVCLAALPEDRAAFRCTQRRMPMTVGEPHSPFAAALRALTRSVQETLAMIPAQGAGASLVRKIGYGGGPER